MTGERDNLRVAPLDIARLIYAPGRNVYGVVICSRSLSRALSRLCSEAERLGVRIITVVHSPVSNRLGENVVTAFVAVPGKPGRRVAEKLRSALEADVSISYVKLVGQDERGNVLDTFHFPIKVQGMRAVLLNEPVLRGIIVRLREAMGSAAEATLWYLGYYGGYEIADEYRRVHGSSELHEFLEALRQRGLSLGWFRVAGYEVSRDGSALRLVLSDNWECTFFRGSRRPQSHFVRGVLSGFISNAVGRRVVAREVKCIAMGDSHCEFVIRF